MTPQSGGCRAAKKTACPVPWATETPEPPSGTRISGFLTELKREDGLPLRSVEDAENAEKTERKENEENTENEEGKEDDDGRRNGNSGVPSEAAD
ncbi:hypothetical protein NDU88_000190 [Pleurodeles waltl]|uniref:Uncharacterized protein n=1 Tax=Pleurodeles waltl TaxID=8319 RepID=A0AAV7NC13_PLEWA|nr:hypothetical protein NDU88_000190 [Pleurodeles waltl]